MHKHGVEFTADDALTRAMIDEITASQVGINLKRKAMTSSFKLALVLCLVVVLGLLMAGCGRDGHATATQLAPPVVSVVQPVEREVTDYADFTGRIEAVDSVQVRARVNGHLMKVMFKEGTEVKKGDVLFEIDPRPYEARLARDFARLHQAEAEVRRAQADFDRLSRIIEENAASRTEYDMSLATRDMAQADVEAAKAAIEASKLDLEFCTIHSPIDGRISRYDVTAGNLVTADQTVLTNIVSTDPIYASFAVNELTFLRVKAMVEQGKSHLRDQAQAPVFLGLANEEGHPHQGTINFADNQVKPSTGTIRVRAVFPNADRMLTPGLFARLRVPLSMPHPAVLVPDRAIATDQGQKVLFLLNESDQVVARPVKPGAMHDGLRAIESGLNPGERVIVEGLLSVRPGTVVNPKILNADQFTARGRATAATNPSVSVGK
jgi:RND family efflux transporter MFP subunit